MTENATYVASVDKSDNSVAIAQFIRMRTFVTFVGTENITDKSGSSVQTSTFEGVILKADITVNWDKSDNPVSLGESVFSVTYDIRRLTDEGDEMDIVYKSVKSDMVSVI